MNRSSKKVLFIINKKSGTGYQSKVEGTIVNVCNEHNTECYIEFTKGRHHATELASAYSSKFDSIVAVGGDGTVNEVAQGLIHSSTPMGIIPKGSGNGLARHLGIPLQLEAATQSALEGQVLAMDTYYINNALSLNVSGIGFDGLIASKFSETKNRGFVNYARIAFLEYKAFLPLHATIEFEGQKLERDIFILAIANSSQYGNNARISPPSSVHDGYLELCLLQKPPMYRVDLFYDLFHGNIDKSTYYESYKIEQCNVKLEPSAFFHADGEPHAKCAEYKIEVLPGSLHIIVPKKNLDYI